MRALLIEGFTEAYGGLGAALRLFWPVLALFGLIFVTVASVGNFVIKSNARTEPLFFLAVFICSISFAVYFFLILCQGAVGWHRKILLAETPKWLSPIPKRRTLQYALPAFMFILIILIAFLLTAIFVLPYVADWFAATVQGLSLTANPTIDQLEAFRRATIPVNLAMLAATFVIMSLIIWAGRSWLMAFPHISVRMEQPVWGEVQDSLPPPAGLVAALLVTYFVPSLFGFLYQSSVPISVQAIPWFAAVVSLVDIVVTILCFLSGLSILSIGYQWATAGKVPYEGKSDLAQV